MKKLSKKKKIIIGIIVVVLVILIFNVVKEAKAENAEKDRIETAVTQIVKGYNMEIENIGFTQKNHYGSYGSFHYDFNVYIKDLKNFDYSETYSLYNDLAKIENSHLGCIISDKNRYVVKYWGRSGTDEDYALYVDDSLTWWPGAEDSKKDDSKEDSKYYCPNCGDEISHRRWRYYTYCEDCYDELGFVEKTPEEQPSYVGKCTICNKDAYNEFQGSPYCDEHYEDAVLWAIDNVSGN